jgi:hypothetical protein
MAPEAYDSESLPATALLAAFALRAISMRRVRIKSNIAMGMKITAGTSRDQS